MHRNLNKKGLRPKRYKRSNPQRKPIRCSWRFTPSRKCKNPAQWMVKPIYRASRKVLARSTCRNHIACVMNWFESKKFTVVRIPDWRKATFEVEKK